MNHDTTLAQEETRPAGSHADGGGASRRRSLVALIVCGVAVAAGTAASASLGPAGPLGPGDKPRWPFFVLALSVALVITLITVARLHAFIALVLAGVSAGLLSRVGSLPGEGAHTLAGVAAHSHGYVAVELTAISFGEVCGQVGLVIALASVIGFALLESGAADKVVRRFLALFGEKHAGFALLVGTYVVSIPIFFDTIFMLLVPLAKALRLRTGKDYILYVLAICCSAAITHSMVIPHPGPIQMASNLHLDVGLTILVGLAGGLIPAGCGWMAARWINSRVVVPLVETPGAPLEELEAVMNKSESELPSLVASLAPIVLPVVLISTASFLVFVKSRHPMLYAGAEFIGNRHVALLISLALSVGVLMKQKGWSLAKVGLAMGPALELAGIMILITAAGGSFGLMLRHAGVGDAIKASAAAARLNLIVLSWTVALVIRVAQGSATVAMLTTSSMVYPLTLATGAGAAIPYHPIYLFLAIGYGALGISWMNDGGFWVVSKLGGLTERETLKTWTVLVAVISVSGLLTTLLLAWLLPFAGRT